MNTRVRLTVGNDVYHLGENQGVAELSAQIRAAVRAGGDLVDLSSGQDHTVLVLITGALPLKIETFDLDAEDDFTWDVGLHDTDYYQL